MEAYLIENPWIFLVILAWSISWKGVALWKAARNNHKKWFIAILLLNTLALLEIIYIFIFGRKKYKQLSQNEQ